MAAATDNRVEWSACVILAPPVLDDDLRLLERVEELAIKGVAQDFSLIAPFHLRIWPHDQLLPVSDFG